jgi:periplasmic divalent cation tolerance protein
MKEEYIQVITTTEKKVDAEKIAELLLNRRLAGCIQVIGPIMSTYWWKNKIEKTTEWLCLAKSKKNLYKNLEKSIKEIHPYETPEIIVLPVVCGSEKYFKWLRGELEK